MPLFAHTPPDDSEDWQHLEDHLNNVAANTAKFAAVFDARDVGIYLGALHDLGKASEEFQRYLLQCHTFKVAGKKPPRSRIDHKLAGAVHARRLGGHATLLALPMLGHHGGMPDTSVATSRTDESNKDIIGLEAILRQVTEILPDLREPTLPSHFYQTNSSCEMFLRMLYSCLVDADYLDTEQHFESNKSLLRGQNASLGNLWLRFQNNQANILRTAVNTPVNDIRNQIYQDCLASAENPLGTYKLSVPTGGGKTRSGMAFALKHAIKHGLKRVIVAIPYTSIIEQNAREYKQIFWQGSVLEHHSAIAPPDSEEYSEERLKMELASENWDMPIVVTTTVQLFESLFSNKPSKCRKLHNLAESVIILDEVQTLPVGMVQPILSVLKELVANYRVSLVLSTATQPAFAGSSPYLEGFPECKEIVKNPECYFQALKRVDYRVEREPWPWEKVAEEMNKRKQVLCVLNSRKDALDLYKLLDDPDALHLSTLMCPAHRRKVIDEIKNRLAKGLDCRVGSTQLIEAGVNVDFPCVMRAIGPLDRIVQAAGRCNREGRLNGLGEVIVFRPEEGRTPKGAYETAMDNAILMLENSDCDLNSQEVFETYFDRLWQTCNLDVAGIDALRKRLSYPQVAADFKMIDDETVSVVTRYGAEITDNILKEVQHRGSVSRAEWRVLQNFSVNIYRYQLQRFQTQKNVREVFPGLFEWQGVYNSSTGISEELHDPADLMT